jgi:Ca2+-binding RTX toxin-like protein
VNTTALSVDLALGRVSFPGQPWPAERLISIENIETGSGNDTVVGSGVANVIRTNAGNDTVRGGSGNDTLIGGLGEDRLFGQDGNDTLEGGGGLDYLNGGSGNDTVVYPTFYHPNTPSGEEPVPPLDPWHVTVNLGTGRASFRAYPGYGAETLVSIENVTTGTGNDILIGNAAANVLDPGRGENLVLAGAGNDIIHGSNTSGFTRAWSGGSPPVGQEYFGEYLDGGAGNDVIFSNGSWRDFDTGAFFNAARGYEFILGGNGNDVIHMGYGDLHVTGGSGADEFRFDDTFVETSGVEIGHWATDTATIEDYSRGQGDRIVIDVDDPSAFTFVTGTADEAKEWGFARQGDDVVATINAAAVDDLEPGYPGLVAIEVRLADYSGPTLLLSIWVVHGLCMKCAWSKIP